ncbi:MAG: hypothetical protein H6Q73_154 [Firmicutes bacterium]|nr:hypothetical protein [Bacillota bacterium]
MDNETEYEVLKTQCIVKRAGKSLVAIVDTIYIDEIPHLVFEWQQQTDGTEKPAYMVPLDPQYFSRIPGEKVNAVYKNPVDDPISLS